nr:reverse transcriptase domain-containing protein [Tanacetum cinerariifolium]
MEIWELKVKGTDLASYTQRFQELALLCGRMFSDEDDKIEKYVGEVRAMKAVFEILEAEVDQNAIDLKSGEIEQKNLLIPNENLIANFIAQDVFSTVIDSAMTASRFHELSTAYIVAMNCDVELERNNRVVHHGYLNRLRDTLDTLHEILKEDRKNVSASCPKADKKQDTIIATTPATRKKHVSFADPLETLGNNPPKIVKQQTVQKTNIHIPHSTRVSNATKSRRSRPESNITHDRTLPANSVLEKKVEDHHKKNKY